MKRKCPKCDSSPQSYSKNGFFVRKSDGKRLQRFWCRSCRAHFSEATTQRCYRQKKRRLNPRINEMFVSGMSQRRIARVLKLNRKTVARKLLFLSHWARLDNQKDQEKLSGLQEVQFDDLETFEHTKLKPLSVTMFVEKKTRRILDFRVSRMPAKGKLAALSRKKYGPRRDERPQRRDELLKSLCSVIAPTACIESDMSPHYPGPVKKWFPKALHVTTEGKRGCVVGQGELKKVGFDPLFSLNHTFAMLRANINRLFRRTWCTTKVVERLTDHIEIYVRYHNQVLIHQPSTKSQSGGL